MHNTTRAVVAALGVVSCIACAPYAAFAQAAKPAELIPNVVEPLPEKSPPWLPGYQARYTLRIVGNIANSTSKSVTARLPTGGWLKPDGSDVAVQSADGTQLPVSILSHTPNGETIIQFPRKEAEIWFWASAVNPAAPANDTPPLPEGIVMESRDWKGKDFSTWAAVREGLSQSDPVLCNALVGEIMQKCNPARPSLPRNYAVTYRGYLNIKADGVYRFCVNSEDASFLFIDGLKVYDRPGTNPRYIGTLPTKSIGTELELKAGVHPVEVHHVLQENPDSYGGCTLLWVPPDAKVWTIVPYDAFVRADVAHVAALEGANKLPAAAIGYGIDDVLVTAGGAKLHIVKFEALGDITEAQAAALQWDFGDGTKGTGRSAWHIYFSEGDFNVTLAGGVLKPYQARVHVFAAPGNISPFSVGRVIESITASDWKNYPPERQDQVLDFLHSCDHPQKWKLLEQVSKQRLAAAGLDPQQRAQLYRSHLVSLARLGRVAEIKPVAEQAIKEFAKLPTLQVGIELTVADIHHRQLHDADEAAARYEALLDKHRRLETPDVRMAAIRWGDLLAEADDLKKAGEMYRLASTLGGDAFQTTATTEAVSRGALLRVAEQKLRTGNINETRMLLDKIELQFPEQKLEGLYRFLRAESDRVGGRYEEALQNYEVLLKLRQWSGYRDRTLHGMASCYAKLGDLPKALELFAQIEKSFSRYYEQQKLAEQKAVYDARVKAIAAAGGKREAVEFKDIFSNFEPSEKESWGSQPYKVVRGLGLFGPHVGLVEAHPIYLGYVVYKRPLANLTPGGLYWIEFWYRESAMALMPGFNPHYQVYLYGNETLLHPTRAMTTHFPDRSAGSWRKIGSLHELPLANDGRIDINYLSIGLTEIDGFSVRAVSDRDADALSNFIEGTGEGAE